MGTSVLNKNPGVILEEVASNEITPANVSTGIGALFGVTEKGPIESRVVTSFSEFVRIYGGQLADLDGNGNLKYPMNLHAKMYFKNGGSRLAVKRIVHYSDITDSTTIAALQAEVEIRDGDSAVAAVIAASAADGGNTGDEGAGTSSGTFTGKLDGAYTVEVTTGGAYGGVSEVTITGQGGEDHLVSSTFNPVDGVSFAVGTKGVELALADGGDTNLIVGDKWTISVTAQGNIAIKVKAKWTGAYANKTATEGLSLIISAGSISGTYKITEYVAGAAGKIYDNLNHVANSPGYVLQDINSDSGSVLIEVVVVLATSIPITTLATEIPLLGGDDGLTSLADDDYIGDAGAETGFEGMNNVDEILVPGCPDKESAIAVMQAMIDWLDTSHVFSFGVISLPYGMSDANVLIYHGTTLAKDSRRYALYNPWINVEDNMISSTGTIIGIYIRNDSSSVRGVWWSPAGTFASFRGIKSVETRIGATKGGLLNEASINTLQEKKGFGLVVWGSRSGTITEKKFFKYIGPCRNTNYIEKTLFDSTSFATHHETGETLWGKVSTVATSFLRRHWMNGGLRGSRDKAFQVLCDESNNPPDLEEAGITIFDVGIWNKKTNEFLFLRIKQSSGEV